MSAEPLASKGEFARLINVSPGRVSQMIKEGKIGPGALDGEGRSAKIKIDIARRMIAARTDPGQRTGNGLDTQLDLRPLVAVAVAVAPADAEPMTAAPAPPAAPIDPIADAIKRERLRSLMLANVRQAEERLAEQGRYVPTGHTQAAMTKMAASMLTVFEGGLADMAAAISAATSLPQRDILHSLRTAFREVRARAAEGFRRDLANLPRVLVDQVADASDPAAGEA